MGEVVGNAIMWLRSIRSQFPEDKRVIVDKLCAMCNRHSSLSPVQRDIVREAVLSISHDEIGVAALLSLATYINTCREE